MTKRYTYKIFGISCLFLLYLFSLGYAEKMDYTVGFIFAGHIRGGETGKINGLLPVFCSQIKSIDKDFVFISGDSIFGYKNSYNKKGLNREWDIIDSYLLGINAPVYRIPSNHDWHSALTKEIYNQRYGKEYYSFQIKDVFFIALSTAIVYPDLELKWDIYGAQAPEAPIHIGKLQGKKAKFLEESLLNAINDNSINSVVIFMTSPLWQTDWWFNTIHPNLLKAKVKLVISGDGHHGFSIDKIDDVLYTDCTWAIVDDDAYSPDVYYLDVRFMDGKDLPVIKKIHVNENARRYNFFIKAKNKFARLIEKIKERM
jgi:hypothetical protein